MYLLKSIVVAGGASLTLAAAAQAADLPTMKDAPPPAPAKTSCTSFQDFLTTACPLSYGGFTVYGTIDVGGGWEKFGAPLNSYEHTGVDYLISKPGRPNIWLP